ncbi:rhamnogalacturonan acetylesterase [Luteolibacter marinus]|uniref:rhamnogalacturonan acetylesterase n=1 Tax=Luteolibacter marinus TaxID=2776705 RepID=UPI0018669377|nr:rhamnogalacturonan acetylesterase [Luteolibacter marinus]
MKSLLPALAVALSTMGLRSPVLAGDASPAPVRLVVIGDSTVCNYPEKRPDRGWGQLIGEGFREGAVEVVNLAAAGRSSKTFITEGRWKRALAERPDYVLVQFGHNDSHAPDRPESTPAASAFKDYLRQYVAEARQASAVPILVTPPVRRTFGADGRILESDAASGRDLRAYADAMQEVGRELQVAVIDLHAASRELAERLGADASAAMACKRGDVTHFNEAGARAMAGLVLKALPEADPGFKALVRDH